MPIEIFEGRTNVVVFNDYLPSANQPWMATTRLAQEMAHSANASPVNVVYLPKIGYKLLSYHLSPGDAAWYTAAQAGIISVAAGLATVALNFYEDPTFAQQVITGLVYAAGVQMQGTPMITARIPTGDDITGSVLTADQASFPSPDPTDPVPLARVFVSNSGAVMPWDNLTFQVYAPASALLSRGTFATFYFNGPASCSAQAVNDSTKLGTGQYSLKLCGDGRAILFELLNDKTWKVQFWFYWNTDPLPVTWSLISITMVQRMWQDANGNYFGDSISFLQDSFGRSPNSFSLVELIADIASLDARLQKGPVPLYTVPIVGDQPNVTVCPVRVDIAAGCKATFQVAKHAYYSSGYLLDDFISFDQPLTTDQLIYLYWNGVLPSECAWTATMSDENGNPCAPSGAQTTYNTATGQTSVQAFVPNSAQRYSQVKISCNASTDTFQSPTLTSYDVYRSPVYTETNPLALVQCPQRAPITGEVVGALPINSIVSIDISPQEADPGAENATVVVEDFTGDLEFLGDRNMVPIRIYTQELVGSSPGIPTLCPIFSGYVLTPEGERRRGTGENLYPAIDWTRWTLHCTGEWARTSEGLLPKRKKWVEPPPSPTAGQPNKITDIIRFAWETRYPPSMVQVPDLEPRLFTTDPNAYVTEAGTRIVDLTAEMGNDVLGSYSIFDESAGEDGMLRLLEQKSAPYNNLAVFEIQHPTELAGDGVPRLPQWAKSYATTTVGRQLVQHTPIFAGTYSQSNERAEGNIVVTTGVAMGSNVASAGSSDSALMTQIAIQTQSYNFFNLSPSNRNYPDGSSPEFYNRVVPIEVVDYTLQTEAAINWKTRRIFDKACFRRFYLSFTAPMLLVTDVTDPYQNTPRRLRFYDAVQVRNLDGSLSQFLVVACAPVIAKDNMEMARYLLVTQSNIDTIGIVDYGSSKLQELLKAMDRINGGGIKHSRPVYGARKQGQPLSHRIQGLPQPTIPSLQDFSNVNSQNFGEFYYLPNYDQVGKGILR